MVNLDNHVAHSGKASLHFNPRKTDGSRLIQNIKADKYLGKRIQLSGYMRATGEANGSLWLRIDGDHDPVDLANKFSAQLAKTQVVSNSSDWERLDQTIDVPSDNVIGIAFGVMTGGLGDVWVDDLKLDIVDNRTPVTSFGPGSQKLAREGSQVDRERAWANVRKAYEGAPLEPRNMDFEESPPR
jgi:hypothetical protein